MEICVPFLREAFPSFLIVNMDYRLGTWSSPGYPKQIKDVQNLITFIRNRIVGSRPASNNATELKFTLLGGSAGAHLALLYSYKYNTAGHVKVVVDVVGPVDFTDPAYTLNPVYNYIAFPLVGPRLFILNPKPYFASSPVKYITSECPATIAFYGNKDLWFHYRSHIGWEKSWGRRRFHIKLSCLTGGISTIGVRRISKSWKMKRCYF